MKLDVLVMAAHPDDAELGCSGTIVKLTSQGKKVGIVDFTRGELGSRGTPEQRDVEAARSSEIMGLSARVNMGFRDGFFKNDEEHKLALIQQIRRYQPDVIIANAPTDRHSDHGRASSLAKEAWFLSGLIKIETSFEGKAQEPWRPTRIIYYIQDYLIMPDIVVDISDYYETKVKAIKAFESQFFNPEYDGPSTYISSNDYWHFLEARARDVGHLVGATYGVGFLSDIPVKIDTPLGLV